jgi:hypothetical protein
MSQVLDLLAHRCPLPPAEVASDRRIPKLVLSGVKAMLDDEPVWTADQLRRYVDDVAVLTHVPPDIEAADKEFSTFDGNVLSRDCVDSYSW